MVQYSFFCLVLWNYSYIVVDWWITSTYLSGYSKLCLILLLEIFWSKPIENIIKNHICIILLKERVYGVHQGKDNSKSAVSVFGAIVGYIECFHKHWFWWYQVRLINWYVIYVLWLYSWIYPDNRNEQPIGDSWKDIWVLVTHFLNGWPKIFWCNCSAFWWYNESNILHQYDNICQSFPGNLFYGLESITTRIN